MTMLINSSVFNLSYNPVSEPAPNSSRLSDYNTAYEAAYDWSTLTGFNNSGVQISSGRLYGVSGANPSAAMLPITVTSTETVRFAVEVECVSGSTAAVYVGFSTNTSPSAGMPGSILAGFNSSIANYVGSGISTSTRYTRGAGTLAAGVYTIIGVATPDFISIVMRNSANTIEGAVIYNRSAMPTINSIAFWNADSRGTSGHNIRAFGVKRSLTPFRTKTVGGQTFEGNTGQVMYIGSSANESIRVHVPKGATGAAMPICLVCHAVNYTEEDIFSDTEERAVLTALENAGYIVISVRDGATSSSTFRWGNTTSITSHLNAVAWVRNTMYAGGLVALTMSGGTVVGHNLITRREMHVRGIYSICGVFDSPELYNDQATFQTGMNAAYSSSDLATFTTNSVGFVPSDEAAGGDAVEYTGKRVKFSIGTSDSVVNNTKHTTLMAGIIAPYATESSIRSVSAAHLASSTYDATDIVDLFNRCF